MYRYVGRYSCIKTYIDRLIDTITQLDVKIVKQMEGYVDRQTDRQTDGHMYHIAS